MNPIAFRYSVAAGQGLIFADSLDTLIDRYFGSFDFVGSARFFRMIRNVLSYVSAYSSCEWKQSRQFGKCIERTNNLHKLTFDR